MVFWLIGQVLDSVIDAVAGGPVAAAQSVDGAIAAGSTVQSTAAAEVSAGGAIITGAAVLAGASPSNEFRRNEFVQNLVHPRPCRPCRKRCALNVGNVVKTHLHRSLDCRGLIDLRLHS